MLKLGLNLDSGFGVILFDDSLELSVRLVVAF